MGTLFSVSVGLAGPLESRAARPDDQRQRWLELLSEYEAAKNEVIGVIENAALLGEEHARTLLAMAKQRRARLEQALMDLSHTGQIDPRRPPIS